MISSLIRIKVNEQSSYTIDLVIAIGILSMLGIAIMVNFKLIISIQASKGKKEDLLQKSESPSERFGALYEGL